MRYEKGHKFSPETLKKISESQKIRLAKRFNRSIEDLDKTSTCDNCLKFFSYRNVKVKRFCSRKCCDEMGARTGQTNSFEHRRKQALKKFGSQNPAWNGGITKSQYRKTYEEQFAHKRWREQIFKKDNYTCVKCGINNDDGKTIKLEADHIKPYAYFPELRQSLSNGQTLCSPCHTEKTRREGRKYWKNQYAQSPNRPI